MKVINGLSLILLLSVVQLLNGCSEQAPEADNNVDKAVMQETPDFSHYPPSTVQMTLSKVAPHSYYVSGQAGTATENQGFISNAGVVITDEGVVVFDALGTPSLGLLLLQKIRQVTDKPIKYVVVSHYHADHIYGLQVFKQLGAQIIAPSGAETYLDTPIGQDRLQERRASLAPWVNEDTRLVRPDIYVDAPYHFTLGGVDFNLTNLGKAHSDADMVMLVEQDRVLYSGDLIFEGRVPFVGNANSLAWLQTLKSLETRQLAALVPGHGPVAMDPSESVALTRHYLAYLREVMGAAVADFTPFSEAYDAVDWLDFQMLPAFEAANRRNAYQIYLALEAESLKAESKELSQD